MHKCLIKCASVCIFLVTFGVQANLIINGGFETPDIRRGTWAWYSANQINGWSGGNLEVWDSLYGFGAYEGNQYIELNAHPFNGSQFSIRQTFTTEVGRDYQVSFAYSARKNIHEAFRIEVFSNPQQLINQVVSNHLIMQWQRFTARFTANSASTTLSFTSVNPFSATVGNLIDDVSVVQVPPQKTSALSFLLAIPVNEPASMFFIAFVYLLLLKGRNLS